MRYDKPALSLDDQVSRLRQRGLLFDNDEQVKHYLTHIGYYRLSAYWLPFELPATDGQPRTHQFLTGTTFDQVLTLYIFDRQLRLLVMEAMERIEIATRTHWAHAMAARHGPHAHLQGSLFKSSWQHAGDIARMAGELKDSSETFIAHYRRQYDEPFLPPIWAVVETLSLGALSRWFKATRSSEIKQDVVRGLGMPSIEILEQVLHALTPVRNICAHHGRLWNRRFVLQLPRIKRFGDMVIEQVHGSSKEHIRCEPCGRLIEGERFAIQEQPARQLYNYLLIMAHLMRRINPDSGWQARLRMHVLKTTAQQQRAMGFPEGWESLVIWRDSV